MTAAADPLAASSQDPPPPAAHPGVGGGPLSSPDPEGDLIVPEPQTLVIEPARER